MSMQILHAEVVVFTGIKCLKSSNKKKYILSFYSQVNLKEPEQTSLCEPSQAEPRRYSQQSGQVYVEQAGSHKPEMS